METSIVEEATKANIPEATSLPEGWQTASHPTYHVPYYFNLELGVSQWDPPVSKTDSEKESKNLVNTESLPSKHECVNDLENQGQNPDNCSSMNEESISEESDEESERDLLTELINRNEGAVITSSVETKQNHAETKINLDVKPSGLGSEQDIIIATETSTTPLIQDENDKNHETKIENVIETESGSLPLKDDAAGWSTEPAEKGWYYRDMQDQIQGPFTQSQLEEWRGLLPMDLLVWYHEGTADGGEGDAVSIELAELLGDGAILDNWRRTCPVAHYGRAPPAPLWKGWLDAQAHASTSGAPPLGGPPFPPFPGHMPILGAPPFPPPHGGVPLLGPPPYPPPQGGPYTGAALAGLPADDTANVIAELAAAQGQTLEEVLQFSWSASEAGKPKMKTVKDPRTGRLSVTTELEGVDNLYQEFKNWCDPAVLEACLKEGSKRKGQKLPPAVWKRLKERKLEAKRKAFKASFLT